MYSTEFSVGSVLRGIAFLVLVILFGTFWLVLVENFTFLDAIYMVVITVSTVGFREVEKLDGSGRIFIIVLIISGLTVMTYTLSAVGRVIIEGSLRRYVGRQRMLREIERLRGHYVVCGHGRMGQILAEELKQEGVPFVVIEGDEELAEKLAAKGYLVVAGDATEDEFLTKAGIRHARGLVAVVSSNVDNLYITMSARELCREDNPELYILTRATDARAGRKIKHAGADRVISPYAIGGMRMVQALLRPTVYDFVDIATQRGGLELMFEEVTVGPGSRLDGVKIADSDIRKSYNIMIIAIKKASGDMVFNPGPEAILGGGDVMIILGNREQLEALADSI